MVTATEAMATMKGHRMQYHDTPPKTIQLKHGTLIIDECDSDLLNVVWGSTRPGGENGEICIPYYANRKVTINGKQRHQSIHRVIMSRIQGRNLERFEVVDHINGNGLDNRRVNLRMCTQSENTRNRVNLSSNNKSGIPGVYWKKKQNRWAAFISMKQPDGKTKSKEIGCFKSIEDAAKARRDAELLHYGEFAPKR